MTNALIIVAEESRSAAAIVIFLHPNSANRDPRTDPDRHQMKLKRLKIHEVTTDEVLSSSRKVEKMTPKHCPIVSTST